MPTYSFRCSQCQVVHDVKRYSDERNQVFICPSCQIPASRYFGPTNINMNGSQSDDAITRFQFEHLRGD